MYMYIVRPTLLKRWNAQRQTRGSQARKENEEKENQSQIVKLKSMYN